MTRSQHALLGLALTGGASLFLLFFGWFLMRPLRNLFALCYISPVALGYLIAVVLDLRKRTR